MSIRSFVDEHYRHFNAGTVARASSSLVEVLEDGGRVFLTLAGAMSTAEIGRSLADMIRAGHIAAISCTGANLEEDVFNLVAHSSYKRIPDWRNLSESDESELHEQGYNRVTDTCIPEEEASETFKFDLEDEITKTCKSFAVNNFKQEKNLIDTIKQNCRKIVREKTGKKPFTNINIARI